MKVGNLGKRGWPSSILKGKKRANESSESRKKRLATQSQYQRQKISNESAECREKRLLNQCQHQNETRRTIVFTWAFCWKLTLFFVLAFA